MKRLIRAVFWAGLLSFVECLLSLGLGALLFSIERPDIPIFESEDVGGESVMRRSLVFTSAFFLYRWVSLNSVAVVVYWYCYDIELNSIRTTFRVARMNAFLVVTIYASWSLAFDFLQEMFVVKEPLYANLGIYGLALSAFVAPLLIWYCIQAFSWVTRKSAASIL